jgi:DNA-binding transcriptional LysR family regulator
MYRGDFMTLRHLKIFVTICDCGSITAASRKLFVSQPSVSAAVREIETEYQVMLFDRISRKLFLTAPGRRLLEQARYLINQYDSIESDLRNWEQSVVLRVGSSITIGNQFLPSYIAAFTQKHKMARVKATVNSSEKIESMLLENELDLALIEGVPHHKNIVSSVFMQDELVVICAEDHPLAAGGRITLEQITKSDLLLREKGSGTRELFDSTMALHSINVEPLWESVSTQALIHAVKSGLGISVLPYWLVEKELPAGNVSILRLDGIELRRNYYVIHHTDKFISGPMYDFIEICRHIGN